MIHAVIDTNVLVSALISHNPNAATVRIMELVLDGTIVPVYERDIITEYSEVLCRPKFHLNEADVFQLVEYFQQYGVEASRVKYNDDMPDEDDRVFYEISLGMPDSYLVTGNQKHFPVTPRVVTPAQMLEIIKM